MYGRTRYNTQQYYILLKCTESETETKVRGSNDTRVIHEIVSTTRTGRTETRNRERLTTTKQRDL